MFNFSANRLKVINSKEFEKARVSILLDEDTNRCYKVYDYQKAFSFEATKHYCISGKINSVDKMYLILESVKEDKHYLNVKVHEEMTGLGLRN
jgi:hypothetical protein